MKKDKKEKRERTPQEQAIFENISACLKHKGMEQKELCEYLTLSPQAFTNWKNKNNSSYMKRLPEIAMFLDVSVDELMGKPVLSELSPLEEKLLQYFSMCDADGQLRIIQLAMNEFERTVREKTGSQGETAIG